MNSVIEGDVAGIAGASLPWEELSGATVVVTGAAGFLPAYMVETLLFLNRFVLEKPSQILALVRNVDRARQRFRRYRDRGDLHIIEQDVSDPLVFRGKIDYVIHAASQASRMYHERDPVGTLSANVLGTYNLLSAARDRSAKGFLFFSSGAIYGDLQATSAPVAEHEGGFVDPLGSRACYAESKRIGETMCGAFARQFGLRTQIVRPWHTYGPGMRLDDGRVFADFVRDILQGGPIVLQSDGSAHRCFCYLSEAVLGFFTVLLKGFAGEAYNVANPEGASSIRELADRLAAMYAHEGMTVRRDLPNGEKGELAEVAVVPSIQKLRALGWCPVLTIEEGFHRTVESYRVAGSAN